MQGESREGNPLFGSQSWKDATEQLANFISEANQVGIYSSKRHRVGLTISQADLAAQHTRTTSQSSKNFCCEKNFLKKLLTNVLLCDTLNVTIYMSFDFDLFLGLEVVKNVYTEFFSFYSKIKYMFFRAQYISHIRYGLLCCAFLF